MAYVKAWLLIRHHRGILPGDGQWIKSRGLYLASVHSQGPEGLGKNESQPGSGLEMCWMVVCGNTCNKTSQSEIAASMLFYPGSGTGGAEPELPAQSSLQPGV